MEHHIFIELTKFPHHCVINGLRKLNTSVPFVVRWNNRPRSNFCRSFLKHHRSRFIVLLPFAAIAPIFFVDLPMFERLGLTFFKTSKLLFLRDHHKNFDEDRSPIAKCSLKIIDLFVGLLPFFLRRKFFDTLNQNAAIPRTIENS